jgi:hypothetical protein
MKRDKQQHLVSIIISLGVILLITSSATSVKGSPTKSYSDTKGSVGDKPLAKEKWIHVKMQASVEKIDAKKRQLTLKGSQGKRVTLTATENIKRFDEIEVGDSVRAEYLTFLRAEFREPTAEEKATPLVVLSEVARAPKEVAPAGVVGAVVKAVVEVVAIDTEEKLVAIQGPRGNFTVLPVRDEAVLRNLSLGEVVIMTYAEAVALSLEKEEAK